MISTLFYALSKPDPFIAKRLENHQEINELVDEVAKSRLKGYTLSCVRIEEKGYTLKARKLEWYEPFTSLFWVHLNEDKAQVRALADDIVYSNRKRLFTQNCTLLKGLLSPRYQRFLDNRLSDISKLNQKLENYKPIRKPQRKITPKDPQTESPLLELTPLKHLFPNIFSFLHGEDLNAFQRTCQKALDLTQQRNSAMHVLKRFINNPTAFPVEKLGPDFRISQKDRQWIRNNSLKISKLFEVCPTLGEKPDHFEFFKQVLLIINPSLLFKQYADPKFNQFSQDFYTAHETLQGYADKKVSLEQVANIDWERLAPALILLQFSLKAPPHENFFTDFVNRLFQENLNGCKNLDHILLFATPHVKDVIKLCPEKLLMNKEFAAALCIMRPSVFDHLPDDVKFTEEVLLTVLSLGSNHIYFESLPNKFKENPAFILKALEINPDILQYLDPDSITIEQALAAVTRYGSVFTSHVPYRLRKDPIILERAMTTYPLALTYAPENLQKDPYFLKLVIYNSGKVDSAFERIFIEANNPALLIKAIEKGLEHINPDNFEMAKAYLKRNPNRFEYLSYEYKHHKQFWLAAVELRPSRYNFVPEEYKAAWFEEAFAKNPEVLRFSRFYENSNKWRDAIAAGISLELAPPTITCDPELVLQAVIRDGKELQFASDVLKKEESIVAYAVLQDKENLRFAGLDLRENKPFEEYLQRFKAE